MKLHHIARAAIALTASTLAPVYASEVVNIPASMATPASTDPNNNCYIETGVGFVATSAFGFCQVDFPLNVPVGHSIKQIAIVHGDKNLYADPYIWANLMFTQIVAPYDSGTQFNWESYTPIAYPSLYTTKLMAQAGKIFPDAFPVQSSTLYHVIVHLERGTTVEGIQVTYE